MKRPFVLLLVVCVAVGMLSLSVLAQDKFQGTSQGKSQAKSQDKLQNTTGNLALGWTEIPKAVTAVTKDTDNPFLGITVGLLKGVANAFARTASGVADVVTLHKADQQEIIKPSMVDIPDTGTK